MRVLIFIPPLHPLGGEGQGEGGQILILHPSPLSSPLKERGKRIVHSNHSFESHLSFNLIL